MYDVALLHVASEAVANEFQGWWLYGRVAGLTQQAMARYELGNTG